MAVSPSSTHLLDTKPKSEHIGNGYLDDKLNMDDHETSESEDDSDSVELHEHPVIELPRVAIGCDEGSVRIYSISDSDQLIYTKSLPRVSGEISCPRHICLMSHCFSVLFFSFLSFFGGWGGISPILTVDIVS